MFGFGDELVIQSYRIPWLIWIQILVTFLLALVILLSFFDFFELETSPNSDSLTSADFPHLEPPSTCNARIQEPILKGVEPGNHDDAWAGIAATTSGGSSETDGSSVEDLTPNTISEGLYHPCRFLDLAKEAFLKCLGLGSLHDSSPREQRHED